MEDNINENNENKDFCALIMAGGKGTRFWPKSTEDKPKQFLNLIGKKTMIQETFERIRNIIPANKIFVVTCSKYENLVKEQLPELPEKNIIIEPVGRNTAPCILLASLYIKQIYSNTNIVVLPSDHIINKTKEFCDIVNVANSFLKSNTDGIVTIGIKPNRPETGYGYIEYSNESSELNGKRVIKVNKFVEKPDIEKAKEYLRKGNYLWNAGMFVFNVDYMLKELQDKFNETYNLLKDLPNIESLEYKEKLNEQYPKCESISIDYAVMEKSNNIYVIEGDFGWDDIGTWMALQRYIKPDIDSNFSVGNVITYNSKNNVVYGGNKKIVLLDVDDIFCIEADDVIVIGKKEKMPEVHTYREKLK